MSFKSKCLFRVIVSSPPRGLEVGDVVLDSLYHWGTVRIASPTKKAKFRGMDEQGLFDTRISEEYVRDITLWELERLKPHINLTMLKDYVYTVEHLTNKF